VAQLLGAPYGSLVAGFSPLANPSVLADFPNGFTSVGSSGLVTAPAGGGFLFLAVNDINNSADNSGAFSAQVSAVPEPRAILLLSGGLLFIALFRTRPKTCRTTVGS